jgi:DNA-3-methyladenine glycosylase II
VRTSPGTRLERSVREAIVPVRTPYRLDLTAIVLRRLSTNVVDTFAGGTFRRLLGDPAAPTLLSVQQSGPDTLTVRLDGPDAAAVRPEEPDAAPGGRAFDPATLVQRLLGTEVDLTPFYAGAATVPWLGRIAAGARGVRPPRYPSLWETICNAIVYQQISIHAAGAILRRTIEFCAQPVEANGVRLYPFFAPRTILDAARDDLRGAGLSVNKVDALKAVAAAIESGELDETALEPLPTPQLVDALVAHRGIGPWTAAVVALRGFGRLDIFPMKDSGATALLRSLSGNPNIEVEPIIEALAPQQGMLYYHLLLGRLSTTGEVTLT